uniref:Uncharacterized protein n=1 Tax=Anguilla anguilla TaxID=7936 RepID=A0A0E9SES5_ANGAN
MITCLSKGTKKSGSN